MADYFFTNSEQKPDEQALAATLGDYYSFYSELLSHPHFSAKADIQAATWKRYALALQFRC